jgi:hypothetical protein
VRALVVVLLLVLVGCGDGMDAASTPTSTSLAPTSTTLRRTTTTTDKLAEDVPEDWQRRLIESVFNDYRAEGIQILEDLAPVESVDRYVLEDDVVFVSVTSGYSSDEINANLAWQLTRVMAPLWEAAFSQMTLPVAFEVNVSSVSVRCPGDFMLRLADHREDQQRWETECRSA